VNYSITYYLTLSMVLLGSGTVVASEKQANSNSISVPKVAKGVRPPGLPSEIPDSLLAYVEDTKLFKSMRAPKEFTALVKEQGTVKGIYTGTNLTDEQTTTKTCTPLASGSVYMKCIQDIVIQHSHHQGQLPSVSRIHVESIGTQFFAVSTVSSINGQPTSATLIKNIVIDGSFFPAKVGARIEVNSESTRIEFKNTEKKETTTSVSQQIEVVDIVPASTIDAKFTGKAYKLKYTSPDGWTSYDYYLEGYGVKLSAIGGQMNFIGEREAEYFMPKEDKTYSTSKMERDAGKVKTYPEVKITF